MGLMRRTHLQSSPRHSDTSGQVRSGTLDPPASASLVTEVLRAQAHSSVTAAGGLSPLLALGVHFLRLGSPTRVCVVGV